MNDDMTLVVKPKQFLQIEVQFLSLLAERVLFPSQHDKSHFKFTLILGLYMLQYILNQNRKLRVGILIAAYESEERTISITVSIEFPTIFPCEELKNFEFSRT